MKYSFAMLSLALASVAGAWDEYGVVAPGRTELDVMVTHGFTSKTTTPGLQVKYGMAEALDIEATLGYPIHSDFSGIDRPNVAVKYLPVESGIGGLVGVDLPFGTKKVVGDDPKTGIEAGLVMAKTVERISWNGWATYNFLADDAGNGEFKIYVKPQYNVDPILGLSLGAELTQPIDGDAYFNIKPGVSWVANEMVSLEGQYILGLPTSGDPSHSVYAGAYFLF